MSEKERWICNCCGEAENCDIDCEVKTELGQPQFSPISADELDCDEFRRIKEKGGAQ